MPNVMTQNCRMFSQAPGKFTHRVTDCATSSGVMLPEVKREHDRH
jgi:hypothetical protein